MAKAGDILAARDRQAKTYFFFFFAVFFAFFAFFAFLAMVSPFNPKEIKMRAGLRPARHQVYTIIAKLKLDGVPPLICSLTPRCRRSVDERERVVIRAPLARLPSRVT